MCISNTLISTKSGSVPELHLGVLVCRTASMCISMYWVRGYTVPAVPRAGHLVSYFNKERRCPFWTASMCISTSLILTKSVGVLGLHLGVLVLGNPSGIRVVDRRLS